MTAAKRVRHKKSSALESLIQDVGSDDKQQRNLINPPGEPKISDAIKVLLDPFLSGIKTLQDYQSLVSLACTAWNISLKPPEVWVEEVGLLASQLPDVDDETHEDMMKMILSLVIRKNELFPNIQRSIVDFRVTQNLRNFEIAIASSQPHPKS